MKRFLAIDATSSASFSARVEEAVNAGWSLLDWRYAVDADGVSYWAALLTRDESGATR